MNLRLRRLLAISFPALLALMLLHTPTAHGQAMTVLVDASRDGGIWWSPQIAPFNPAAPHQGKALADHLRSLGYTVAELPRGATITPSVLAGSTLVIHANEFGSYTNAELDAYRHYVSGGGKLLLLSAFKRPGESDSLASVFGLRLAGTTAGSSTVGDFTPGPITADVLPYDYFGTGIVGRPSEAIIDARLSGGFLDLNANGTQDQGEPSSPPVLGHMPFGTGRIVFSGGFQVFQSVIQPLTSNVIKWLLGNVAQPTPSRTVVVFLSGLTTSLTQGAVVTNNTACQQDEDWGQIIARLQTINPSTFGCDRMLRFSYNLGYVDRTTGRWTPEPYDCFDTGQGLAASVATLTTMLLAYSNHWKERGERVDFILVGHSLGGLIAFQTLASLNAGGIPERAGFTVSRVITLDSPLKGAAPPAPIVTLYPTSGACRALFLTSEAIREVKRLSEDPAMAGKNQAVVAGARGTQVITTGNSNDCLYWPGWCARRYCPWPLCSPAQWVPRTDFAFADRTDTQLVSNAAHSRLESLGPACAAALCTETIGRSHTVILTVRAAQVAGFIAQGP
jgi:pimeloyl-ACP methyl ester carboxylesterase